MTRRRGAIAGSRRRAGQALTPLPTQPGSIMYTYDEVTAYSAPYQRPGALVVAGRDNYNFQGFKDVSAAGGHVLLYLDAIIDNPYGRYHQKLNASSEFGAATSRWPGNYQCNEWGYLNDFRVGSVLLSKLEAVLELAVNENPHIAGFFADDVGSRSWFPGFSWDTFGSTNQSDYRAGAVAVCQAFRNVCNNHGLIFVVNGTWGAGTLAANGGGYPTLGTHGNALADGGVVEHHTADEISYWSSYVSSTQWASQSAVTNGTAFHFAMAGSETDRAAYVGINKFAYVQTGDYSGIDGPWGSFHPTGLPTHVV